MQSGDVEIRLIAAVVSAGSLSDAKRESISEADFPGPEKKIWQFIVQNYADFQKVPSAETIEEKFGIKIPNTLEPVEYWSKELKKTALRSALSDLSIVVDQSVSKGEVERAFDEIEKFVKKEKGNKRTLSAPSFEELKPKLEQRYADAKAGKMGVPTPWPTMNSMTLGWWPGDVSFLAARLGVGKTNAAILIAKAAVSSGHSTMIVSCELSEEDMATRHAGFEQRISISYIRKGTLFPAKEKEYLDYLKQSNPQDNMLRMVNGSAGMKTPDLDVLIEQHKPKLVIVDASYRMRSAYRQKDRFENMAAVSDELKAIAMEHKVPIVATTQLNRGSTTKKEYGDDDVALSDVVGWVATNLFALKQTDEQREARVMGIHALKIRESENMRKPLLVNWDFHNMLFSEIGMQDHSAPFNPTQSPKPSKDLDTDEDHPWL